MASNGNEITRELVEVLTREHSGSASSTSIGSTIEDHIITASLGTFKGRNKKMIEVSHMRNLSTP